MLPAGFRFGSPVQARPVQPAEHGSFHDSQAADNIPAGEIMFGEKDMSSFAHQVGKKGNKAYTFREFN